MPFYSYEFLVMMVSAIGLYKAGELDHGPGLLWAALSLVISFLIWQVMGWGILALFLGQVALSVGIGVTGAMRDSRDKP